MLHKPESTESLLDRTKKLLSERGDTSLREIADGAELGLEWVKSIAYGRSDNPGIKPLEKLYSYLVEFHAAKRFRQRSGEVRAG